MIHIILRKKGKEKISHRNVRIRGEHPDNQEYTENDKYPVDFNTFYNSNLQKDK